MEPGQRPAFIKHQREIRSPDDAHYRGSDELLSIGSPLGRAVGLSRIGIHHEELPPGRRTSWPHAESDEEEFVYVIEGRPDVWLDGHLFPLEPGDAVGFPAGTGIAHTFINNTQEAARLLVVGEANKRWNRIVYPLHPARNAEVGEGHWRDAPQRELGPHDGMPDALRHRSAGTSDGA
ncbi:cupin domain-containing protein [Polyangium sp. 6x1]|uniref:cupin domain-containing protein n=1 Tax=Polyangium sp. 6x1 TaxID=3042689 RepID=UPI0032B19CBB